MDTVLRVPIDLVASVDDRSASGIAAAIGRLITAGDLPIGTRLPTVRELAKELDVSPTTVAEAWQSLASAGAIETHGRRGTWVRRAPGIGGDQRYRRVTDGSGRYALDLSTGTPDPELLPDLRPALAQVSRLPLTSTYLDAPVLAELDARLRGSWPFPVGALTVVDGAMDAIDRIARAVVRLGDRVVVEHPTFPPILDLLADLGAEPLGVALDEQGPLPDRFAEAMALEPSLVVIQPRAQNPTGTSLSARRAEALAELVAATEAIVVEDDHSGDVASSVLVSLGRWVPDQVVHVRSFSKSHGPDLRLAAVGGAAEVVDAVAARRLIGPGWTSRVLQAVLVGLLDDPDATATVRTARKTYAQRRTRFAEALAAHGIALGGGDGINAWVEVSDEQAALADLAAQGIGVAPGTPFCVRPGGADHLRVTIGLVRTEEEIDALAAALARAGRPATA